MNMRPIQRLSPELRDQIAAGEVVERPASVVKELVENALDAEARTVRVEIEGGGLDRIYIVDDGFGMTAEDAILALQRHTTSKLASFDELFRLGTFGFRGEALAAIASVTRLRITTRRVDAPSGAEITIWSPGEPPEVREVGAPVGTAVDVRDLFFVVPARRKFIKSVSTEAAHVADTLLDLALSRPDVAFTLVREGKITRQYLRASDRGARARDAMSRSLQEGARAGDEFVLVGADRPRARIQALLSPPERARNGAQGLHLLVNGRAVRDKYLSRAVAMAYGSVLDPGKYPLGVVYLEVPTEEVDVNVHPQKAEVRFARGRDLYEEVTRSLAAALAETFRAQGLRTGSVEYDTDAAPVGPRSSVGRGIQELSEAMGRAMRDSPKRGADPQTIGPPDREADPWGLSSKRPPVFPGVPARDATLPSATLLPQTNAQSVSAADVAAAETTLVSASTAQLLQLNIPSAEPQKEPIRGAVSYASLRYLAQVRATYLLCEGAEALYVIDQHAAAERVNFARLKAAYARREIARQQLLVPEVLTVSSAESVLVDETRDQMLTFGVDARAIGDGRVAVSAVPAMMTKASPGTLLRDLLDELARSGGRRFSDAADLLLATMACHGSVRAGDAMHPDEVAALLHALDEVDFAGYCPHGRPIVTTLPFAELEKKVGRR